MKLGVLHTRLSGHFSANLRELRRSGHASMVFHYPFSPDAPFSEQQFDDIGTTRNSKEFSPNAIIERLSDFGPDAILVAGWSDPSYRKVCRHFKKRNIPIIAGCDNQWKDNLRQQLASVTSPIYLQRFIDILWVPGERQRQFAEKLGFHGTHCWEGYYSLDWEQFSVSHPLNFEHDEKSFSFAGRYAAEKGIDTLLAAYQDYRSKVSNPWRLKCAGRGDLSHLISQSNAEDHGFIQPADLPNFLSRSMAFILPSRYEPWGVVINEAAATGLPLLVSEAAGSRDHLLKDGWNGRTINPDDPTHLCDAMIWLHHSGNEELATMGKRSFELSQQFTPKKWVETLLNGIY